MRLAAAVAGPGLVVRGPAESRVDLRRRARPAWSTSGRRSSNGSTGSTRSRCSPCSTARWSRPAISSPASRSRRTWSRARRSTGPSGSRRGPGGIGSSGSPRSSHAGSASSSRSRSTPRPASGSRRASGSRWRRWARALAVGRLRRGRPGRGSRGPRAAGPRSRTGPGRPGAHRGLGQHRPVGPVLRGHRPARRPRRPPRRAGPSRLDALAGPGRPDADILGLPTCGAYSKATAADLLLPRLLSGERASAATVARLGRRRHPDPVDALPVPGRTPASSTRPKADPGRDALVRPGSGRAAISS